VALQAPAVVLSVILGWSHLTTTLVMGGLVILYTTTGGIKAVQWGRRPADGDDSRRAGARALHGPSPCFRTASGSWTPSKWRALPGV
jgi:hypothetical protein